MARRHGVGKRLGRTDRLRGDLIGILPHLFLIFIEFLSKKEGGASWKEKRLTQSVSDSDHK